MADQQFAVEFEFTSTHADRDNYTVRKLVNAKDQSEALCAARLMGFSEFGARFTDNCVDWRVVQ